MVSFVDCTLRDGGYYTNWDFSQSLVEAYLEAMAQLEVSFVELGFRFLSNTGYKGPYAYTSDSFINSLNIPERLRKRIGVMVNASDFVVDGTCKIELLEKAFCDSSSQQSTKRRLRRLLHS